ncbi:CREB-binding protein [Cyclospora cayetanensis]|uniref:CREB-binding protein n=1 Tax=Cyclospora cayetanensis TaxID=88456 RepID=A0A6P6RRZ3_9EIME|nr:CREB-binding protein [Cyclospora cayetanensis]
MALPLQPAWREPAKRQLPSSASGQLLEEAGTLFASPPKAKARRLEGPTRTPRISPPSTAAVSATVLPCSSQLQSSSPLSLFPLKRRLQPFMDAEEDAGASAAVAPVAARAAPHNATAAGTVAGNKTRSNTMLQSPVRMYFPLTARGTPHASRELPAFPSGASRCAPPADAIPGSSNPASLSPQRLQIQPVRPQHVSPMEVRRQRESPLALDARSLLTAAATAAAAGGAQSPQGAQSTLKEQQRCSFLADLASPFSSSKRSRALASPGASGNGDGDAAAASRGTTMVVAAAVATPSSTRRATDSSRGAPPGTPGGEPIDYKVSPVSSRRRASPYHGMRSTSTNSGGRTATLKDEEALSAFRLTPPRKKPQLSFDSTTAQEAEHTQQTQEDDKDRQHQGAAPGCASLHLTRQQIASMQRLFLQQQQQQHSDGFCCSSLDSFAATETTPNSVPLNRQLERLCRLYGLLRILFDRFHDRGEPLLLFTSILPAYTKLALTHHPRSASESPLRTDMSDSNASSAKDGGERSLSSASLGSSKVRHDLIKDVGRLVWLLPQLLQWKPRKLRNSTAAPPPTANWGPLQQNHSQYDIQILELKDGVPLSARAKDGEERQQQLRRRLIAYALQWQNYCLEQQQQQQQQQPQQQQQQQQPQQQLLLLRWSRERLIQHASWAPGFDVEMIPSPPAATTPALHPQEQRQNVLLPQQPPGAFKGDPVIGCIGGSPVRCVVPEQQPQKQQLNLLQQLQDEGSKRVVSPPRAASVSGASSVNSCWTDVSPYQRATSDATAGSNSPAVQLSPLSRGRQPVRRFPLLSSPIRTRSPSPLDRRSSSSSSTSPTRSPVSERLRRKTEERMAARLQQEAAQQLRRELYDNVQRLQEAHIVLQCLLDACVYHDRRSCIDIRVLTDLFVSKVRTPLPLPAVERAVLFLEGLSPPAPAALRKVVESQLREAQDAAFAADSKECHATLGSCSPLLR